MIYIVTHKKFDMPEVDQNYRIICVGREMRDYAEREELIWDGNGKENITKKNPYYCELTALYWIWKNDTESDIVGLNHYRRYFLSENGNIIDSIEIKQLLSQYDIILPVQLNLRHRVEQFFCMGAVYYKDLEALKKVISELYPEYMDVAHDFFKGYKMSYANMFIMRKKEFDAYCTWLFHILFTLEGRIDISGYTASERRVYGYLAELLLNIFVLHNSLKVKYLQILNTEPMDKKTKMKQQIKKVIKIFVYFPSGIPRRRRMKIN